MPRTNLREVLEHLATQGPGLTAEKDAVTLLDLHLGRVQGCQPTDALAQLIEVRDGARQALKSTFAVRTTSVLARSHADALDNALGPLERLIDQAHAEAPTAQQTFEQRWRQVGPRVEQVLKAIAAKSFGASLPAEVHTVLARLETSGGQLAKHRAAPDYVRAGQDLDLIEKDLAEFDKAYGPTNDQARKDYLVVKSNLEKGLLAQLEPALAAGKLGQPVFGFFADAVNKYTEAKALMDRGEKEQDYPPALKAAKSLATSGPVRLKGALNDFRQDWQLREAPIRSLLDGLDQGAFAGVDGKALKTAMQQVTQALKTLDADLEVAAARALFEQVEQAAAEVRKAIAKSFVKGGAKTPKAARAQAVAMLKRDPDVMKAVADEPGGGALIDTMVQDLGGKAKDADSKAFVRAAITARFGPELGNKDLTTKYLPRLYKALGMVPASHTLDNPMLRTINRDRTKLVPSGDYEDGKGVINLQVPRTGLVDSMVTLATRILPEKLMGKMTTGSDVTVFDLLALHEVGHAVDDKLQFMNGKAGNVTYGGWQKHAVEEVAAALGTAHGFFKDCAGEGSKAFLTAYLKAVLEKKKPQAESSVTSLAAGAKAPNWKALAQHAAVEVAENIRLKSSDKGLWDRGDSAAKKYAIGSSVYQECYEGQWVSYALSARASKVTDYQFRADGEWYAEAYAAFFVGKLPASHPLHPVLTQDKQSTAAAQRAAR